MTPTAIHEELSTPAYRGDLCDLLEHLRELVETARSMPLSNSAIVNRDEVLELLDETMERLPEELRQARWLLKEREEFLERARREADEIVAAARVQAEGMVQRTEVVREAQRVARITIEQAEAHGRQLRNQAEDYVDAKLASFEATVTQLRDRLIEAFTHLTDRMAKALEVVERGRERLRGATVADEHFAPEGDAGDEEEGEEEG